MKKAALFFSVFAGMFIIHSCDMDRESPDSIRFDRAFENMDAVEALERGAYSRLRTSVNPYGVTVPDIQADYVNAVNGYSNTYGNFYQWSFTYDASEIESMWYYMYAGISHYNFVIDGIRGKLGFEPTSSDEADLSRIKGVMHLMRAYSYSALADRFCADYDEATARNEYTGLPLIKYYDTSIVPERATLFDTYDFILKDLDTARTCLTGISGSCDATVLNEDCVDALEARVYLQMDNYAEAYASAQKLTGNDTYSLVDSQEELQSMWTDDKSTETIFQFYSSVTEVAYQWGYAFYQDYYGGTGTDQGNPFYLFTPDYIPTQTCIDMYDAADWRRSVYFRDCDPTMLVDGSLYAGMVKGISEFARTMVVISKFPGNPALRTSASWNYYNTWKVFRLAEMYLIEAEAAVMSGKDAATPLNELRNHRGLPDIEGEVSLQDVKNERYRELLLEGFRLSDLKRWNENMSRGTAQTGATSPTGASPWYTNHGDYTTTVGRDIVKEAGDYMFVWPIPASEIFANPQLESQQNPGWIR